MNFKQMQDRTLSLLQQDGGLGYYTIENIKNWINEGYTRVNAITGGQETAYYTNSVVGQQTYELPSTILKVDGLYIGSSKVPARPIRIEQLNTSSGYPKNYLVRARKLYLSPVPNTIETLKIVGTEEVTVLADDTDETVFPEHLQYDIIQFAVSMGKLKQNDLGGYFNLVKSWGEMVMYDYGRFRNFMHEAPLKIVENLDGNFSDY